MRVSISGEKSLISAIQAQMEQDQEGQVERLEEAKDKTELAFGIGEVLTLVSIVKGITEMVKLLLEIKPKLTSGTQKLYFKTALGTTVVELSPDITAEELHQHLGTIIRQS
jgi:hypothetical protein